VSIQRIFIFCFDYDELLDVWTLNDAEFWYKLSLPAAWMAGYDDFDWLARRRNAAWVASGLDGTGTQYWTQASANMAAASFYTAGALEGAAAIGISEVGHATSIRCAYTTLWNEAAVVSATGTMFPAAYQRMPSGIPVAQPVTNCFTAGTQIVVGMEYDEDGNFVSYVTANIEDIKVGDLVYSYDTATGEVSQKAVTGTFSNTTNHINQLTITDEHGNEQIIETTDGHPFWVVTDNPDLSRAARCVVDENGVWLYHENIDPTEHGYWVEAKDLRVGDVFLGVNGELSTLTNIVRVEQDGGIGTFNFTVEGNHDYFILAKDYEFGQSCILVHNNSPIYVTKDGVALPPGRQIPSNYVQNPHWPGSSYGEMVNGKYVERIRIDPPTPVGMKGPNFSHYHLNKGNDHFSPRPGSIDPGF